MTRVGFDPSDRPDKRCLRKVFGLLRVARQLPKESVDGRVVFDHEAIRRIAIA